MSGFVVLEGGEGVGKSTLIVELSKSFLAMGVKVLTTREPGATSLGKVLRDLLLDPQRKIDKMAELLLFAADRAQHVGEVIRPAINDGALVLCDRYVFSTIAYQGYGRGIDLRKLEFLNSIASSGLLPDLVLLLDLEPEIAIRRVSKRLEEVKKYSRSEVSEADRFENCDMEFHRAVRRGFLNLASEFKDIFVTLDASKSPQVLVSEALALVRARCGL